MAHADDVFDLVTRLRRAVVVSLSEKVEGGVSGCGHGAKLAGLSSIWRRRCRELDILDGWVRKLSPALCQKFMSDFREQLNHCAGDTDGLGRDAAGEDRWDFGKHKGLAKKLAAGEPAGAGTNDQREQTEGSEGAAGRAPEVPAAAEVLPKVDTEGEEQGTTTAVPVGRSAGRLGSLGADQAGAGHEEKRCNYEEDAAHKPPARAQSPRLFDAETTEPAGPGRGKERGQTTPPSSHEAVDMQLQQDTPVNKLSDYIYDLHAAGNLTAKQERLWHLSIKWLEEHPGASDATVAAYHSKLREAISRASAGTAPT